MLNLDKLHENNKQKKYLQKNIYEKIFKLMCETINFAAESGEEFCLYQVPEFLIDEISYPLTECIEYLEKKLKKMNTL